MRKKRQSVGEEKKKREKKAEEDHRLRKALYPLFFMFKGLQAP